MAAPIGPVRLYRSKYSDPAGAAVAPRATAAPVRLYQRKYAAPPIAPRIQAPPAPAPPSVDPMGVPIRGRDLGISAALGAGGVVSSGLALFGPDSTPDQFVEPEAAPASSGRFGAFQAEGYRPRVVGSPGIKTALNEGMDTLRESYSPALQADIEARARESEAMEAAPLMDRAGMFVRHAVGSPARLANTVAEGVGNVLPTMAAGRALAGVGTARKAAMGIGGVLGAGAVRENIYQTTYDSLVKQGVAPEVAAAAAQAAQAYTENPALIAAGTAAGVAAGRFGADEAIIGAAGGQIDDAARAAARGVIRSAAAGAVKEGVTEAPQEGLETYLGNVGAIGAGAEIDPFQGALEAGVKAGIMSAIPGAAGEAVSGMRARRLRDQPRGLRTAPGPIVAPITPQRRPSVDPTLAQIVLEAEIMGGDGLKALMDTGMSRPRAEAAVKAVRAAIGPKAPAAKGVDRAEDRKAAKRAKESEDEDFRTAAASFEEDPLATAPRGTRPVPRRDATPEEVEAYLADAQRGVRAARDEQLTEAEQTITRAQAQRNLEDQAYAGILGPPPRDRSAEVPEAKIEATRNFDDQAMAAALEKAQWFRALRDEIAANGGPAHRLAPLIAEAVRSDSVAPLVNAEIPRSPSQLRKMLEKAKARPSEDLVIGDDGRAPFVLDDIPPAERTPVEEGRIEGVGIAGDLGQRGEVEGEARRPAEGVGPVRESGEDRIADEALPGIGVGPGISAGEADRVEASGQRPDVEVGAFASQERGHDDKIGVVRAVDDVDGVKHEESVTPSDPATRALYDEIATRIEEIRAREPNLTHAIIAQRINKEFGTDSRLGAGRQALSRRIVDEILTGRGPKRAVKGTPKEDVPVKMAQSVDLERNLDEAEDRAVSDMRREEETALAFGETERKLRERFGPLDEGEAEPATGDDLEARLQESVRDTRGDRAQGQAPGIGIADEGRVGEEVETIARAQPEGDRDTGPAVARDDVGIGRRDAVVADEAPATSEDREPHQAPDRAESDASGVEAGPAEGLPAAASSVVGQGSESVPPKAKETPGEAARRELEQFRKERNEKIDASKRAGAQHLDQLPHGVEAVRGVKIRSIFDGSTGVVTSANSDGTMNVQWDDEASSNSNSGSPEEGKKGVEYHSALFPGDFGDFVVEPGRAEVKQGSVVRSKPKKGKPDTDTVPVERPKKSDEAAEVESTQAQPQAPAVAAEKVTDQIERVVDTQGVKSAKEVHERVMAALQEELAAAKKVSPFKEIGYFARGTSGGKPQGTVTVDGKNVATVGRDGMRWIESEGKKDRDIEVVLGRDWTHASITPVVRLAMARELTPKAGSIRVQIPGDGTFTIARNIVAIEMTLDRIRRGGPAVWKSVVGYKPGPPREAPKAPAGGPVPIIRAMMDAASDSLMETAAAVSAVRYGDPGTILFEYKGDTYSAPEPVDVMPAKDTKGTDDEASRAWAAKQIRSKAATKVERPTMAEHLATMDAEEEERKKRREASRPAPAEPVASKYSDFTAAMSPMERGRAVAALEKAINTVERGIDKRGPLVEKMVADGFKVTSHQVDDPATRRKLEAEWERIKGRYPIGNPSHPETVHANEVRDRLKGNIRKVERRLGSDQYFWSEADLGKTAMDYAEFLIEQQGLGEAPAPEKPTGERAQLIEKIVAAAAAGRPKLTIHEVFELKGTDGKWYGAGGMPLGVRSVEPVERRSKGFGTRNEDGIGVGVIKPTREAQEERLRDIRESNDSEFRAALEAMTDERLKSQAEYWLKDKAPATPKAVPKGMDGLTRAERKAKEAPPKAPEEPQAPVHPKSIEKLRAAIADVNVAGLRELLHPSNKNMRAMFTDATGLALPKGVRDTWDFLGKPETRTAIFTKGTVADRTFKQAGEAKERKQELAAETTPENAAANRILGTNRFIQNTPESLKESIASFRHKSDYAAGLVRRGEERLRSVTDRKERAKIQKEIRDLEAESRTADGFVKRYERALLAFEGDEAQRLIVLAGTYDAVDKAKMKDAVAAAVDAHKDAADLSKKDRDAVIDKLASGNHSYAWWSQIKDVGLEKAVDASIKGVAVDHAIAAARKKLLAMEGLDHISGYGKQGRPGFLRDLERSHTLGEVENVLSQAEAANEAGLENKRQKDRKDAEEREQARKKAESLKAPIPAEIEKEIRSLTNGEYEALVGGVDPEVPTMAVNFHSIGDAVHKRLEKRGVVEPLDPEKGLHAPPKLTPKGQELARQTQRYDERRKFGLPISERAPSKATFAVVTDADTKMIAGKYKDRDFYSEGHFLVEGKMPEKRAGKPVQMSERFGTDPKNLFTRTLEPKGGPGDPVQPVAFYEDPKQSRAPGNGEFVVFSNGFTVNGSYLDYVRGLHPDAEMLSAGPDAPLYFRAKDGRFVGVVMGIKSGSAPEGAVAHVPEKEDDEKPSFSRKPPAAMADRDLIIQHNLTAANLVHADKMGGLAVPSMAVAKRDMPLEGFGEITLLGDRNLADPRESGMQVFGGDIYSPRYPTIRYKIRRAAVIDEALKESNKAIGYSDWHDEAKKSGGDALSSGNPNVVWTFLKSKGIDPDVRLSGPSPERMAELRKVPGLEKFFGKPAYQTQDDPEFKRLALEELRARHQGLDEEERRILRYDKLTADQKRNVIRHLAYEIEDAGTGRVNRSASRDSLRDQLESLGLAREFETFRRDLFDRAGAESKIFKGFTNAGNERTIPHTLENVVSEMRRNMKAGEGFSYGPGTVRGAVAPRFRSISEIRGEKDRIVSKAEMQKVKDEVDKDFWAVAERIPAAGDFGHGDRVVNLMVDAARMGLPRALREYGLESVGEATREEIAEFMDKLRTVPTEYFEAKLPRAVEIGEFKTAVVPNDVDPKALAILERHGLKVEKYDRNDPDGRKKAIRAASEPEGMSFSRRPEAAPAFFSQLQRAAEQMKQPMRGAEALRFLTTREGVKAAELKWTGLDEFLQKKAMERVTPQEIQEFLKANAVTVTVVKKGEEESGLDQRIQKATSDLVAAGLTPTIDEDGPRVYYVTGTDGSEYFYDEYARKWQSEDEDGDVAVLSGNHLRLVEELDRLVRSSEDVAPESGATKFSQYQLPGGTNYREVLLTLPAKPSSTAFGTFLKRMEEKYGPNYPANMTPSESARMDELRSEPDGGDRNNFRSSHFDEPNILAHVRINDRTVDGKKVLFIEEIQSDWAQKGRREGIQKPDLAGARAFLAARGYSTEQFSDQVAAREAREMGWNRGVPSAPFIEKTEDWTALALKSILHKAASEGYDSVAWTTGDQQNARYDLAKQVDKIMAFHRSDGTFDLMVFKKGDRSYTDVNRLSPNQLEDTVGKDLAAKIVEQPKTGPDGNRSGGGWKTYEGLDLAVGGKGMREFYDKIVPQVAEKIGRKFGAKVGTTEIGEDIAALRKQATKDINEWPWATLKNGRVMQQYETRVGASGGLDMGQGDSLINLKNPEGMQGVHSIEITPQMRESAREGFPLFNRPTTEADWEHYNGRQDTDRDYREAYKNGVPVVGAPAGVRIVDFEGDVDKSVLNEMARSSASLAAKIAPAVRMIQAHVPDLKFGGFTPAGNLHGVQTGGRVFVNQLATHQIALETMKAERITYPEAFARAMTDVLVHEAAHYADAGHGDGFVAELTRILDALGPVALRAIRRDFMQYASQDKNRAQNARMYEKALPGWREGERRGREAADALRSDGDVRASPDVAERLHPRPRSDTGDSDGDGFERGERQGSLFAPYGDQAEGMASFARVRGTDGRVAPGDPRRDENFRKWFGDSKVVDVNGKPLVVYHGTQKATIKAFRPSAYPRGGRQLKAIFFTPDPENASEYANDEMSRGRFVEDPTPNVVPVFLKIENPLFVDYEGHIDSEIDDEIEKAIENGHDGLIVTNADDGHGGNDQYVVFRPEQIKSATGNRGTFDPKNPDIRYSRKPAAPNEPDTSDPSFWEKVTEWRKGAMLSSVRTLAQNVAGNVVSLGSAVAEIPFAAAADRRFNDGERQVYAGEMGASLAAFKQRGPEALGKFGAELKNALKGVDNIDKDELQKFERRRNAIGGGKNSGPIEKKIGTAIRTSFRIMAATDEFFKDMAYQQALYREAYRQARNSGLTGAAAATKVDKVVSDFREVFGPDRDSAKEAFGASEGTGAQRDMHVKAERTARYRTFTQHPNYESAGAFGWIAEKAAEFERTVPVLGPALGLAIPFKSTPAQIAFQAYERTPFAAFSVAKRFSELRNLAKKIDQSPDEDTKAALSAQVSKKTEEAVNTLAKAALGTVLAAVGFTLAAAGLATGSGPPDPDDRRVWEDAGNVPNAIRLGDSWYAYDRLDPLMNVIGLAANLAQANDEKDANKRLAAYMNAVQEIFVNNTFLDGFQRFSDMMKDPARYGKAWLQNVEGSFVPSIVRQTAEAVDPTVRSRKGIIAPITSGLPGFSKSLPAVRTGTGEPAKRIERLGGSVLGPLSPLGFVRTGDAKGDPLSKQFLVADYAPDPHRDFISVGVGPVGMKRQYRVDLTEQELEAFRNADARATQHLRGVIESDSWASLPPDRKKAYFIRVYSSASAAAKKEVMPGVLARLRSRLDRDRR